MSFSSSGVRETFTVKGYPVVPKIVNVCYYLGETPKGRRRDGRVLCPKRWQSKFQTIFRFARSWRFCKGMVLEAAVNGHADALVTLGAGGPARSTGRVVNVIVLWNTLYIDAAL